MDKLSTEMQKQVNQVFNFSGDGYSVDMKFNLKTITSIDDIKPSDNLFEVVNQTDLGKEKPADALGLDVRIGTDLVENLVSGKIKNNRTIGHELGHTGGLDDANINPNGVENLISNLMTQTKYIYEHGGNIYKARGLEQNQVKAILINQGSPIIARPFLIRTSTIPLRFVTSYK